MITFSEKNLVKLKRHLELQKPYYITKKLFVFKTRGCNLIRQYRVTLRTHQKRIARRE